MWRIFAAYSRHFSQPSARGNIHTLLTVKKNSSIQYPSAIPLVHIPMHCRLTSGLLSSNPFVPHPLYLTHKCIDKNGSKQKIEEPKSIGYISKIQENTPKVSLESKQSDKALCSLHRDMHNWNVNADSSQRKRVYKFPPVIWTQLARQPPNDASPLVDLVILQILLLRGFLLIRHLLLCLGLPVGFSSSAAWCIYAC